jgi:general nucleoside transport system ATP-binding protein
MIATDQAVSATSNREVLLSLRKLSKRFGRVKANQDISFDVYRGEILGLLGENGAGKSTLMSILSGNYQPDSGEIWWKDRPVNIIDPRNASHLGIGMVHQHFTLIPELSVAENVVLGTKSSRFFFTDLGSARKRIRDLSERYGLDVDPDMPVWQLPMGVRQRVEILKILYRGTELLILDEPTAVLTPQETEQLLKMLAVMSEEGRTIIFVSHKFHEVRAICRRVIVLRSGKVISDLDVSSVDNDQLARLVVGEEIRLTTREDFSKAEVGDELLRVENLSARDERELLAFSEVSFSVSAGEIIGIAGIAGNGQGELIECLAGLRAAEAGRVLLNDRNITNLSPRQRRAAGIAHIPEDRRETGCILDFSIEENLILGEHDRAPVAHRKIFNSQAIHRLAQERLSNYHVKADHPLIQARLLSGGNLQKLVLARELSRSPLLVLAAEPTRGLDVAAVEFTYQQFMRLREQGKGILLISSDLDEIIKLSDHIYVMFRGRLLGPIPSKTGREKIGYTMMTGEVNL